MDQIRKLLADKDTILFIGSGISRWSGLPTWPKLISELADFLDALRIDASLVRSEAQAGDLLQAASYGFDRLSQQQITSFMRTSCRVGVAQPHDIHKIILSLGPRSFITTNYDTLLEQALQRWQPERPAPLIVTNRNLPELAEIGHTRATNFIFKPHGHIQDSESIILSREQYRSLLPQGERYAALETLKTLLATRPILYLGFGLRDPEFFYLRDILINIYKGAPKDHYAIMPDILSEEQDYWRRNYGIHLLNYATRSGCGSSRDHTPLLDFLDKLLPRASSDGNFTSEGTQSPVEILTLARHAARLTRFEAASPEYNTRVYRNRELKGYQHGLLRIDEFDHRTVEKFLVDGPHHSVLVGLPGSGKTYAFRKAAAGLGEEVQDYCLRLEPVESSVTVPVYVDLKLYTGSISNLVDEVLPRNLPLKELAKHKEVKLFLDSFNEMPKQFRETGSYATDFAAFFGDYPKISMVVGSRTTDGLSVFGFPVYSLDLIEKSDVKAGLLEQGHQYSGPFYQDVLNLLQRPFYFRQVLTKKVILPSEPHPTDFHKIFFANIQTAFQARFRLEVDIQVALSVTAYSSLDRGEEAFPLIDLVQAIQALGQSVDLARDVVHDAVNWLIYKEVLVSYSGGRVAFVHQALTEYLAASELARRYTLDRSIAKDKLRITRWDQCLFQTIGQLPKDLANCFVNDIVALDLGLALRAAKYLEFDRESMVSVLLEETDNVVRSLSTSDFDLASTIASALEYGLPITQTHSNQLWRLVGRGGSVGAAATRLLVEVEGEEVKQEMLERMVRHADDFNLCCNGIAPALVPFVTINDAQQIAVVADDMEVSGDLGRIHGFVYGAAKVLSRLPIEDIRTAMVPDDSKGTLSDGRAQVLCYLLQESKTEGALELAGELLLRGVDDMGTTIFFIARYGKEDLGSAWCSYNSAHVTRLLANVKRGDGWSLRALRELCSARQDLREIVARTAKREYSLNEPAILYCVSTDYSGALFSYLEDIAEKGTQGHSREILGLLDQMECNWSGKEELFVRLLRVRDSYFASVLFGGAFPPMIEGLGILDIGQIDWWLEWMLEEGVESKNWRFLEGLSGLFGGHLEHSKQLEIIFEFNRPESRFRSLLLQFVLPHLTEFSTDAFTDEAVGYILANMDGEHMTDSLGGHVIGSLSTEEFISEHLLPRLKNAEGPRLEHLHRVLRQAGARFGKRFLV